MNPTTDLVDTWSGAFGDAYQVRNASNWKSIKNRTRLFENVFEAMEKNQPGQYPSSILEVGAGVGDNLRAIDTIYERGRIPVKLFAIEPHEAARDCVRDVAEVMPGEIADLPYNDASVDLVFTSGVLIHTQPDELHRAMQEVHRVAKRWVLCIEYFNPTPDEVEYRGQKGMLFRRDWGSEWLDRFPDLKSIGYGFMWKRVTGLDNVTWWLFEKTTPETSQEPSAL
jgi:pseudaminic acid biosynthesis-associated methylase